MNVNMTAAKQWVCVMAAVTLAGLASGCFKVKDHLTIGADGAGTVQMEVRYANEQVAESMGGYGRQGLSAGYPPLTESQAKKMFDGDGITVRTSTETGDKGVVTFRADVAFKDVNALLESRYGQAHALRLSRKDGVLRLQALSGLHLASAALSDSDEPMQEQQIKAMEAMVDPEFRSGKTFVEFKVTMPGAIDAGNGANAGNTATWAMDRAKMADDAEASRVFGQTMTVQCAATGISFAPVSPIRLEATPFAELEQGEVAGSVKQRDAAAIAKVVEYVPVRLTLTRSMDLTGRGGRDSMAMLDGMIVLPREHAPDVWGKATLTEAVDGANRNLSLGERGQYYASDSSMYGLWDDEETIEEEGSGGQSEGKPDKTKSHRVFQLVFKSPGRDTKKIAHVKGETEMRYFGPKRVLKLDNVVPVEWVVDMANTQNVTMNDDSERALTHPDFKKMNLAVSVAHATNRGTAINMGLKIKSSKAVVTAVQVYDADGKPVPTMSYTHGRDDDEISMSLQIKGAPKYPLSLALMVASTDQTVKVPFEAKDIELKSTSVTTK